jgi:hypothetical protein
MDTQPNINVIESPASWNTRYVDTNGFECQLTIRGDTGHEVLEKATSAINFLLTNGCVPYSRYSGNSHSTSNQSSGNGSNSNGSNQDGSWCPIHNVAMKRWEKDGRVWYSHKVDGQWCSGKPKRS